jgi:hypothetical protein
MILNNYVGKRIYYTEKDLKEKVKEKPFSYKRDILKHTCKDQDGKTFITPENFEKLAKKYKNKTNIIWKIKLFFKSMYGIAINWWKYRKFKVSKEIANKRFEICKACDSYNKTLGICSQCGCRMRWKTTLSGVVCPNVPPKWV